MRKINYISTQHVTNYINKNLFVELVYNTFAFPCENSRIVLLTSLIMNNIAVFPARSRFLVKLICCITFGSESGACCLLRRTDWKQLWVISLVCGNFSSVFIRYYVIFYWIIKTFLICSLLFLLLEEKILCALFWLHFPQTIIQKVCWFL